MRRKEKRSRGFFSWHCECDEERGGKGDGKNQEVNKAAGEKFKDGEKPALPINATNRQQDLDGKGEPENCDPAGRAWGQTLQANRQQNNQHDRNVSEGVNMQRIDEVVDVEDATPDIKNFQEESEERDAAKHHVREVVDDRAEEQLCLASMFSYLFFGAGFYPLLERS